MKRRDTIIGVIVIVLLGILFYRLYRNNLQNQVVNTPTATPDIQRQFEQNFNITIPEDTEKLTLKDVSGGDSTAIATRKFQNGKFMHVILADLPEPKAGFTYQGWLVRGKTGDGDYAIIKTGTLSLAKGGYILEFNSNKDYSSYNNIIVSEDKPGATKPGNPILEGSF